MGNRNLYLDTQPLEQAVALYTQAVAQQLSLKYEKISVTESLGRITKEAIYAKYSSPLFNAAAMDGIAVISGHTHGASEREPKELVLAEDYQIIDTGDPLNPPFDAVIMAEDLETLGTDKVVIRAAASPWQHVRPVGEDIVVGEMILPGSHLIRPIDIGVLLSAGINELMVVKQPTVAIFPTGSEIIESHEQPKEGSIIDSNSWMFVNMVQEQGGLATRFAPLKDDYQLIKERVLKACKEYDLVIVNAGSSAGTEDYTVHVLRELGQVLVHGIAIKPGKPVILALIDGKPVIGLPGYPVSAYLDFEHFVTPILALLGNRLAPQREKITAVLSKRLVSSLKHREYVRVNVGQVGGKLVAAPLARGAGAAMSLVRADGFCVIEQNCEGLEAGSLVEVELYRSLREIADTLMIIGSHDLILDVLADMLPLRYPHTFISSTHVGSMAGLMALQRGETHLAPIHLLDEKSGQYNIPDVKRLFNQPMALIKGVGRIQGLMVKKGNPLEINSLADLPRLRYINRQRGAGTRILLDYKLKHLGINPDDITGYAREAATHLAVAAAVDSGSADAGMGILSAAKAMNLDFIEIGSEEYDFALPTEYLSLEQVQHFIELLKDQKWRERVVDLGGYTCEQAGDIIFL